MTSYSSPPQPPQAADSFFDSLRRIGIARTDDRWIGGVAAGVAHRLGIDPLIIRGALLLVTLFGGLGLLLYGLAWALLPERSDGRVHLQEAFRGRFDAALAGAILMVILGLSRVGFWWSGWDGLAFSVGLIALIALAAVVVLAIQQGRRSEGGHGSGAGDGPGRPWPEGPAGPAGPAGPGSAGPAGPAGPGPAGPAGPPPPPPGGQGGRGAQPAPSTDLTVPFAAAGGTAGATIAAPSGPSGPGGPVDERPDDDQAAPEPSDRPHDETEVLMSTTHSETDEPTHPGGPGGPVGPVGPGDHPPMPPAAAPQPPAAPAPPPRPRVPGPGATLVRIILGLVLLVIALLLAADYTGVLTFSNGPGAWNDGWSVALLAIGSAVALLGLGAVIAGLRGRRAGSLGVLGTIAAIIAVPMALTYSAEVVHRYDWGNVAAYSDQLWRPATAAEAAQGYDELAGGALRVDLTDLQNVTVTDPVEVGMGAGQIIVMVPEGMPVTVEASVTGEITTYGLDDWTAQAEGRTTQTVDESLDRGWRIGGNREVTLTSPAAEAPGEDTPLELEVDLGFGEIVIEETS